MFGALTLRMSIVPKIFISKLLQFRQDGTRKEIFFDPKRFFKLNDNRFLSRCFVTIQTSISEKDRNTSIELHTLEGLL